MKPDGSSTRKSSKADSPKGVQTIHRAIGLLRMVVNNAEQGMSLSSLAHQAGLHVATARRSLGALVSEGLLSYNPMTKRYYLGMELYNFGSAAHQFQIRDHYHHILESIASLSEDTVYLMIRSGNDAVVVDRVEGEFPIRALTHEVGQRSPLGIGAGSMVLLASLPEDECRDVIQRNRRRYESYENVSVDLVWEGVKSYWKRGYSQTGGVFLPEARAVGRPVRNPKGEVEAAISIAAIAQRMQPERREWLASVIEQEINANS